jgi:GNAT superfamily N-acetyltransferase
MVELRPPRDDGEVEQAAAQNNRLLPRRAYTAAELLHFYGQVEHEFLLAWDGETLVGAGAVYLEPGRVFPILRVLVEPAQRNRGTGRALCERHAGWARERGHAMLESWIDDDQPEAIAFAESRGFTMVSHDQGLELDLRDHDPPLVPPPPGVEIVQWSARPELAHGLYEVACEAYVDIPGEEDYTMEPFEGWLAHDMQGWGDSKEATFVAVAGDEVVGYSKFSLSQATPTVAKHDLTGVKRDWRGRGVARALKSAQIRWAKEHGYERLLTSNEDRNVPITKLNREFGYRAGAGRGTWRGPTAGP